MKLSVIIPAHNEVENLPVLFRELDKMIRESGIDCEVILVDDGSTDGTYERAKEATKQYRWLKVAKHGKQLGVSEA
ncbi:MAG: hypothetical protein DRQ10_04080, partial [Candidatus Hydrothermota bacterium]